MVRDPTADEPPGAVVGRDEGEPVEEDEGRTGRRTPVTTGRRAAWVGAAVALLVVTGVATFFGPWALGLVAVIGLVAVVVGAVRPDRRLTARRTAALCGVVVVVNLLLLLTGIPGVRPSLAELHRVADKIDAGCGPGTASVDVWRGGIAAMMTPGLTPEETRLLYLNGKVLCMAEAIR